MTDVQQYSVDSAREAADADDLNEWVARFLASPGSDNAPLGEELTQPPRHWIGPLRLPISKLHRLAGPPGEPVLCPVDDDDWADRVYDMEDRVREGWEPPPVIVSWRYDQLVLEDGNHRVESLRRAGEDEAWAVVGFETAEARDQFCSSEGSDHAGQGADQGGLNKAS